MGEGTSTRNGGYALNRLRDKLGTNTTATCTEVFQYSGSTESQKMCGATESRQCRNCTRPFSAQALGHLTISGLAPHGQTDLENHLRLRAPLSWQEVQTKVENIWELSIASSSTASEGHWRRDMEQVSGKWTSNASAHRLLVQRRDLKHVWQAWTRGSCSLEKRWKGPEGQGQKARAKEMRAQEKQTQRRVCVLVQKNRHRTFLEARHARVEENLVT